MYFPAAALAAAGVMMSMAGAPAAHGATGLFPANAATGVNPDTHLVLTFASAPKIGASGLVRIVDLADGRVVETLDLGLPAGPDPSRRIRPAAPTAGQTRAAAPATPGPRAAAASASSEPASPTTTTPAVNTTPADLHNYQLMTIGGLADFHFHPIIVHDNTATIYPHHGVLQYGHRYAVKIDASVLTTAAGDFAGMTEEHDWTFATKAAPPAAGATRVVVAADGSGDFNTIQGAVDFVPAHPAQRVTIFIRNGNYEEIVFCRDKSDLTFRGEDREKVQVGYGNNSAFNPPMPGPSRRCAFSAYNCTGLEFTNFTISNYYIGQAEALLIAGSKNVVDHMSLKGSGDALNLRGPVYFTDSLIKGDGDTILGVGPAFFRHCELQSVGPFMWIRNTDANHGNVFVDCTFTSIDRPLPWTATTATPQRASKVLARLPNNHGLNYPYAEAVLIDCHLDGIPPEGWGPIDDDTSHIHFWEFHSTDKTGQPIETKARHSVSRQLDATKDAETIAHYRDPAFVLGGWKPEMK